MTDDAVDRDAERLAWAASRLRRVEREVLALGSGEGLRNDEIAARLGMTPKAVERVLARAVRRLDRLIERPPKPWWKLW